MIISPCALAREELLLNNYIIIVGASNFCCGSNYALFISEDVH